MGRIMANITTDVALELVVEYDLDLNNADSKYADQFGEYDSWDFGNGKTLNRYTPNDRSRTYGDVTTFTVEG